MEIELNYPGYFLVSAASGDFHPYYSIVESFKIFDPKHPLQFEQSQQEEEKIEQEAIESKNKLTFT